MITNIDINKLQPHTNNPRKDLGDLTELAESIKINGVMQNLTIVDNKDYEEDGIYTVIIGHRRLAAAKLAGLKELPCAIVEMTQQEQISIMLIENMQRSDLTPIEQANGLQMMMDFGDTVTGISEKTGFSDSTIRKRLALTKLNQKELQESYLRGGTLMDYAKLEQLKDEKAKNKMLQYIGTRDFDWQLKNAIDEQEKPERKKALFKVLDEFAKEIDRNDMKGMMSYEISFHNFLMDNWKKPKDADTAEYYYVVDNYSAVLYKKIEKEASKELSFKEKEFNKREAKLKNLSKLAYELRYDFVKNFNSGKKYAKEINGFAFQKLIRYGSPDSDKLFKILDVDIPDINGVDWRETEELKRNHILEKYRESPERVMFLTAYIAFDDKSSNDYFYARSWDNVIIHENNKELDLIYETLISLGYQMSDEERALQDGTHELFVNKEA